MTVLADLHARRDAARASLKEIDERISALTPDPSKQLFNWQRGIAVERIELFLLRHSLLAWSPAELILATQCTEAAVRRALTDLVAEGRVQRQLHARYRHVDPTALHAGQVAPLNASPLEAWPAAGSLIARSVDELDLSVRAANCLLSAEIKTIGDLTRLTAADLLRIRWVNKKVVRNIEEELAVIGLALTAHAAPTPRKTAQRARARASKEKP